MHADMKLLGDSLFFNHGVPLYSLGYSLFYFFIYKTILSLLSNHDQGKLGVVCDFCGNYLSLCASGNEDEEVSGPRKT